MTTSGDDPPLSQLGARITDTPVPAGSSFPVVPIIVDSVDAGAVPDGVTNWDFFQGALLAVLVKRPGSELILQPDFVILGVSVPGAARPPLDDPQVCGLQTILRWPRARA